MKSLKQYMSQVEGGQLNEMQNLDVKQMPGAFSITDPQTHTNITTSNPGVVDAAKKGELQIGKMMETDDEVNMDMDAELQRKMRQATLKHYKENEPEEFPNVRDQMAKKGHEFGDEELDEETMMESIEMMPKEKIYESTLDEVIASHPFEHKQCQEGWGMDQSLFEALMDHYYKEGRIPRSVWHGPEQELRDWVEECYGKDTGMLLDETRESELQTEFPDAEVTVADYIEPEKQPMEVPPHLRSHSMFQGVARTIPKTPSLDDLGETMYEGKDKWIKGAIKKPGSFTKQAKQHGETPAEFAKDVLSHKDKFSAKTEKRANLAKTLGKMKECDAQMEAWDKQFDSILNEGQSVSISLGQENMPDSVTVTANDQDAHELIKLLQNAGMGGVVGAAKDIAQVADMGDEEGGSNTMMSQNTDGEEGGEVAVVDFDDAQGGLEGPSAEDNGDTALSFLKKMLGQKVSMTPSNQNDAEGGEAGEEVVYGNDEGGEDSGKEEADEGNKFTGNLAKARAAGKETADLDGDGDEEKVKEGGFDREKFGSDGAGSMGAGGGDITKESGDGKKPDDDNDGVPDWADKKKGEDDNAEDEDKEKVDEGEWDDTAATDMAAAVAQDGQDAESAETEKATAMAEGHEHTCNECGSMMAEGEHECMECGYTEDTEMLDEWANQVNSKTEEQEFTTEMDYMMKLISGGLNNQKVDQTVVPSERVKVAESNPMVDLRKLAGLR